MSSAAVMVGALRVKCLHDITLYYISSVILKQEGLKALNRSPE